MFCVGVRDRRTSERRKIVNDLAVPRYQRPSQEWPRHKSKAKARRSQRSKVAKLAQQRRDLAAKRGVV